MIIEIIYSWIHRDNFGWWTCLISMSSPVHLETTSLSHSSCISHAYLTISKSAIRGNHWWRIKLTVLPLLAIDGRAPLSGDSFILRAFWHKQVIWSWIFIFFGIWMPVPFGQSTNLWIAESTWATLNNKGVYKRILGPHRICESQRPSLRSHQIWNNV